MNATRTSSTQVRRMFEEFCAAGLTPEESLSALRNDGFSQADLVGLAPEKKFTISRGPREYGNAERAAQSRKLRLPSFVSPGLNHQTRTPFALSAIWTEADARPWHMLLLVIAGGASLAALTAWKLARLVWRKVCR